MYKISHLIKYVKNRFIKKVLVWVVNAFLILVRAYTFSKYLLPNFSRALKWLFNSRETSNFSYQLTESNKIYLAHQLSVVTGSPVNKILGYISEIENDKNLRKHIEKRWKDDSGSFNYGPLVAYGRRVGWYAVIRILKPKVVVETGVDQGLGSCVITAALIRNSGEGKIGRYYGTDNWLGAGSLFYGEYKKYGEILYGDSLETLKHFKHGIDVFINDSDHSALYEAREYEVVDKLLKPTSIVFGDNSHESQSLVKFAEKTDRNFLFFKEEPNNHWYPGAGIGMAYGKKNQKNN